MLLLRSINIYGAVVSNPDNYFVFYIDYKDENSGKKIQKNMSDIGYKYKIMIVVYFFLNSINDNCNDFIVFIIDNRNGIILYLWIM